jgi:single-stranded DNA-binding protein
MATSIFERSHHQRIAKLLGSLNVDLLTRAEAFFGGGTAIALSLGEFRESRDVDFLVSSQEGYRLLREAVTNETLGEILREPLRQLRAVRMDRYSIRTALEIEGEPIRIEFVSEGELGISGAFSPELGVPTLSRDDMYATKLLANANRALDKSVLSRDIIDLAAMVDSWGDVPDRVWDRTIARFGTSVERGFHDALRTIADPRYLASCLDQMRMDPSWLERIPKILSTVTLPSAKRAPQRQTGNIDPILAAIATLKAELDGLRPIAPGALRGVEAWQTVELTYTSNAIEGNTLTRAETALIVDKGLTVGRGRTLREHLEVTNHVAALGYVRELASNRAPLTERDIRQVHALVMAGMDDMHPGQYSPHQRQIAGSDIRLPAPSEIAPLMADLVAWLAAQAPTPDTAIEAHARLAEIHPFSDGNGRTSRLLMNLVLMRGGYPPAVIEPADRLDYIEALEARRGPAPELYRETMLGAVEQSLARYLDMVSPGHDLRADHTSRMSAGEPPKGGGTLSAMYNPRPLESASRTDPSTQIERFEEMKPQTAAQEGYRPGAYAAITGEVVRTHEFEKVTTVTVKSDLADGFTRYNSVMLFDAAARRAAAGLAAGDLIALDARVNENVFVKDGHETYRTDVIANRVDRADPGTPHEASLTVTGELRRGMQAMDKVTMGSLVSTGRDGEPRYHTIKAFDPNIRGALESPQIGDRLTLSGTIGQNSYEKDGKKVFTTDLVVDRVVEHTPAPRPAPAPLPTPGNEHHQEHKPTNRPH